MKFCNLFLPIFYVSWDPKFNTTLIVSEPEVYIVTVLKNCLDIFEIQRTKLFILLFLYEKSF
jgi:hypothetical protein